MVDVKSKSLNDASDHIMLLDSSKDDEADSFDDDDDDEDIIYNASNSNKQSIHNHSNAGNNNNKNKKRLINLSSSKLNKKLADAENNAFESIPISLFKFILMNFSFILNVSGT